MKLLVSVIMLNLILIGKITGQENFDWKKFKEKNPLKLPDEKFHKKNFLDSLNQKNIKPDRMPEQIVDQRIDYKMKIWKPDSTIDFKILRKRYPGSFDMKRK